MPSHSFLLYVEDPIASASFYEMLLRAPPVEASPGFAMFALTAPTMLGLWKRADVLPKATAPAGSNEIGFTVESDAVVDQFHHTRVVADEDPVPPPAIAQRAVNERAVGVHRDAVDFIE